MTTETLGTRAKKPHSSAPAKAAAPAAPAHAFLRNVSVGENFSGVYFLEKVFVKLARNGNKYSDLTLRDKSGSIFAKFWGEVTSTTGGEWVEIAATVEEYQGNKNIVVQNITVTEAPTDLSNYMATSDTIAADTLTLKSLFDAVREQEEAAKCDTCSAILDEIFKNGFVSKFETSPASAYPSYGRIGGLLAYTVRVANLVRDTVYGFDIPAQEKAIALTAALLHRIGAAYAFEMVDCMPKETTKGALVGSLNLGFARIANAVNRVAFTRKDDPSKHLSDDVVARLMHAIVASAPDGIKPMTREAIALHGAVSIVSELSDASDYIANDQNPHEQFTAYDPITKRRFFKGE